MPRLTLSRWLLLAVIAVAGALAASVASAGVASKQPQTYKRYTVERTGTVLHAEDLRAYGRGYAILPATWKTISRNGQIRMRFSVPGSCKAKVDVFINQMADQASETAQARALRRQPGSGPYLYGEGSRGTGASSAWRVTRVPDTKIVRAFFTTPLQNDWPGLPAGQRVWLEVRATAKAMNPDCHTGGMREAVAFQLVTAFGAMGGTGYPVR